MKKTDVIAKPESPVVLNRSCSHFSTVIQDAEKRSTRTNICFKTNTCRSDHKTVHQSQQKWACILYSFLTDVEKYRWLWVELPAGHTLLVFYLLVVRDMRCKVEFYLSGVHLIPLWISFFISFFRRKQRRDLYNNAQTLIKCLIHNSIERFCWHHQQWKRFIKSIMNTKGA